MSITPTPPGAEVPANSFRERLARRRQELESAADFVIAVPGYEDLYARYRVLGFEETRRIGMGVEQETDDQATAERLTAAATLAEACLALLERRGTDDAGKPVLQETGYAWSEAAARDLFAVDIPVGVAAREAIQMIFPYPRDLLMMTHFEAFLSQNLRYLPEIDEMMRGESAAPSGATS